MSEETRKWLDDWTIDNANLRDAIISRAVERYESGGITREQLVERINDRECEIERERPAVETRTPRVAIGRNEHHLRETEKWVDSMLVRDHVIDEREATALDLDPYITVDDIAGRCLRRNAMAVPDTSAGRIEKALKMGLNRSAGTDDFSATLNSIGNKSLNIGYSQAPETWRYIVRETETRDFRLFDRVQKPELPTPALVKEHGEIKFVHLGDVKEQGQVNSYAHIVSLGRHAVINDDLSALTVTMAAAGRAASRLVGDLVYTGILVGNPTMADGYSLFDETNHGNVAATGAAPSVTTLDEARTAMSAQTGPSDEVLNIRPGLLVGPTSLESTLAVLRDALNTDPSDDPLTPGYKAGRLSVVTDARLDAASTTAWYCCASPRQHSGVEVVTLQDSRGLPLLEQMTRYVNDAIEWRVLHDVAVLPTDFRTWYYNAGA